MKTFLSELLKRKFELPADYKTLIKNVASGDRERVTLAIRSHRKFLLEHPDEYRLTVEYGFMHEVDTPIPDLLMRIHYRKILTNNYGQPFRK